MPDSSDMHAGLAPSTAAPGWSPRQLALGLGAGFMLGLINLGVLLSLAALIFAGPLSGFVSSGVGLLLVGASVVSTLLAFLSSRPSIVGSTQDAPAVVVALIAANIVAGLPAATDGPTVYATVVAAMALTTLATGATFLLLGQLRLGSLVRYLPYPVVGGFLAGTGWLLTLGAVSIMVEVPASFGGVLGLLLPPTLWQWLPGVALGVVILLVLRRGGHVLSLPGMLVGAVLLFYGWLALNGVPVADAQARGWLLGPFPEQVLWSPLTPGALGAVQWPLILGQLSAVGAAVIISVLSMLLNVSGLQLVRREDIDLNRELRAAGLVQLAAGLSSGAPGFHVLSFSRLAHQMGANTRVVGIGMALLLGAAFFFGAQLIALIPRVVLGGVVCFLGLSFLSEWLYDTWSRLPRLEYGVIVLITALIAVFGILPGVIAGLVLAVMLFVVIYSRIDVVKHALSGANIKSRMTRGYAEQELLRANGDQIAVFQLQGFIFFGTANELFERVRERVLTDSAHRLRFVLLDFRMVPRLDSTAMFSFGKLRHLAETRGLTLVITQPAPLIRRQFEQTIIQEDDPHVRLFADLDHGLEWCENQLLANLPPAACEPCELHEQLARIVPEGGDLAGLLNSLERRSVAHGDYLIRPDDPPDDMFFVESGQVTAYLEGADGERTRLESMRGGRAIGELGFYLGRHRTAAVVADEPSSVLRITREGLRRLERERPEAAATLHLIIARLLSERAVHLIETVDALQR